MLSRRSTSRLLVVALASALLACSKVRDIKRDAGDEQSAATETDASQDGGRPDEAKRRLLVQMEAKLRECGVISRDGKYTGFANPSYFFTCPSKCFLKASCAEAKTDWCRSNVPGPQMPRQGRSELDECQERCFAQTVYCDATLRNVARCDDSKDCPDGSDEVDCEYFVCADGQRIHFQMQCDGEPQCHDGSDEDCLEPQYECEDGEVPRGGAACDGVTHCQDESDERGCIERGLVVECPGGGWVPTTALCDGRQGCGDGWDETQGCAQVLCDPG